MSWYWEWYGPTAVFAAGIVLVFLWALWSGRRG